MSQLSILLPFALPDTRLPLSPGALAALEHGRRSMPVRETGRDYLLFQLFGVPFFPGRLPAAPIAYWGASGEQSLQWCMRIDPVHLHARRHELVMVREPELGLLDGEAADLAAEVENQYADLGWRVVVAEPDCWILFPAHPADIDTTPPSRIGNRNIDAHLPAGPDAVEWRQRLNEIQMLFHDATVNTRREPEDALPINSVWFWGGGTLPAAAPRVWDQVFATDPLSKGLSKLTSTPVSSELPATTEMMDLLTNTNRKLLLSLPELFDDHWRQTVVALLEQAAGSIQVIRPDGAVLHPDVGRRRRWWHLFSRQGGRN